VIFSLSPAQGEPTFTPAHSPPAPSSSPSSYPPVSKAVRSPQVLSINTLGLEPLQSPPSPSPSFLPDKPVSLTDCELLELANKPVSIYRELLELLNLPENLDSIKLLAEYSLVPDNTLLELGLVPNHTSLEPSPSPSPPLSPLVPSSLPYVPPQLYTAPAASSASRQAPASSAAPCQSPASPAPASSLGPPFVSYVKIEKGCFYCHNKHPSGLRHTYRNHCPWFHHYLAVGTCHLNDRSKLYLGPKQVLAQPLPFWSSTISQGEQVKRCTDSTEWDEVVERRVWNPVVFRSGSVLVERQKL
jgi:hypothetical protein